MNILGTNRLHEPTDFERVMNKRIIYAPPWVIALVAAVLLASVAALVSWGTHTVWKGFDETPVVYRSYYSKEVVKIEVGNKVIFPDKISKQELDAILARPRDGEVWVK